MVQIKVTVVEGRNLKKKDLTSESDPYVQIYLDDSKNPLQTTTKYNSNNPKWNEVLVLYETHCFVHSFIETNSFSSNHRPGENHLHVHVYDQDYIKNRKIKHDHIGSITIDLDDLFQKRRLNCQ